MFITYFVVAQTLESVLLYLKPVQYKEMPVHRCKCLLYCLVCMETIRRSMVFNPNVSEKFIPSFHIYDHLGSVWVHFEFKSPPNV